MRATRILTTCWCLLVGLAAVVPGPALSQGVDDMRIVPGERIGAWTLAMTVWEIEATVRPGGVGSTVVDIRPGRDVREG